MADREQLKLLKQGVEVWNQWRKDHPKIRPNLSRADLRGVHLEDTDLHEVNLRDADLTYAWLTNSDLTGADLREARVIEANFVRTILVGADLAGAMCSGVNFRSANLAGANLSGAFLAGTTLTEAILTNADLSGANLEHARLVETNLEKANLTGCPIYGISAWSVQLEEANQSDLIITKWEEPTITVDNLEVAQFIYLLLNNKKIRDVIDTITSKVVLILGRFSPERKAILDAIRDELRKRNYLPILFDFDKPASKDIHETITTLARLARFVIADITNPKSIPQELVSIVETLPSLPVQPLLKGGTKPWGMYDHIKRYPWVLELYRYKDLDDLLASLQEQVIDPAEQKAQELAKRLERP